MKKIFILIVLILISLPVMAKQRIYAEKVYQTQWCNQHNGTMEYVITSKSGVKRRVDCLTDTMAVEFDYANKWHECLGQAIDYGTYTKRQGACILIVEKEKDSRYVNLLRQTIQKKNLDIRTRTVKPSQIKI